MVRAKQCKCYGRLRLYCKLNFGAVCIILVVRAKMLKLNYFSMHLIRLSGLS